MYFLTGNVYQTPLATRLFFSYVDEETKKDSLLLKSGTKVVIYFHIKARKTFLFHFFFILD